MSSDADFDLEMRVKDLQAELESPFAANGGTPFDYDIDFDSYGKSHLPIEAALAELEQLVDSSFNLDTLDTKTKATVRDDFDSFMKENAILSTVETATKVIEVAETKEKPELIDAKVEYEEVPENFVDSTQEDTSKSTPVLQEYLVEKQSGTKDKTTVDETLKVAENIVEATNDFLEPEKEEEPKVNETSEQNEQESVEEATLNDTQLDISEKENGTVDEALVEPETPVIANKIEHSLEDNQENKQTGLTQLQIPECESEDPGAYLETSLNALELLLNQATAQIHAEATKKEILQSVESGTPKAILNGTTPDSIIDILNSMDKKRKSPRRSPRRKSKSPRKVLTPKLALNELSVETGATTDVKSNSVFTFEDKDAGVEPTESKAEEEIPAEKLEEENLAEKLEDERPAEKAEEESPAEKAEEEGSAEKADEECLDEKADEAAIVCEDESTYKAETPAATVAKTSKSINQNEHEYPEESFETKEAETNPWLVECQDENRDAEEQKPSSDEGDDDREEERDQPELTEDVLIMINTEEDRMEVSDEYVIAEITKPKTNDTDAKTTEEQETDQSVTLIADAPKMMKAEEERVQATDDQVVEVILNPSRSAEEDDINAMKSAESEEKEAEGDKNENEAQELAETPQAFEDEGKVDPLAAQEHENPAEDVKETTPEAGETVKEVEEEIQELEVSAQTFEETTKQVEQTQPENLQNIVVPEKASDEFPAESEKTVENSTTNSDLFDKVEVVSETSENGEGSEAIEVSDDRVATTSVDLADEEDQGRQDEVTGMIFKEDMNVEDQDGSESVDVSLIESDASPSTSEETESGVLSLEECKVMAAASDSFLDLKHGKLLTSLREEFFKLREEFDRIYANNRRLSQANASAGISFETLHQHAEQLQKKLEEAEAALARSKDTVSYLRDELAAKELDYEAEHQSRLKSEKILQEITDLVQHKCEDSMLVKRVLLLAGGMESVEAMALPTMAKSAEGEKRVATPKRYKFNVASMPAMEPTDDTDSATASDASTSSPTHTNSVTEGFETVSEESTTSISFDMNKHNNAVGMHNKKGYFSVFKACRWAA